jgi:endo-1,4-beta-mannosidase
MSACSILSPSQEITHSKLSQSVTKRISFAILEDYDKGEDLEEIAKDFELMNELGVEVLRCSLGWDDFEPVEGEYDFAWLKDFVRLAAAYNIKLRPYIGYTPRWAGTAGSADGIDWNNPPADHQAWYRFVYRLAYTLRDYPNVLSYEIYNEQNVTLWWDGSVEEYMDTLRVGALAIRLAHPEAQILLGGLVYPDHGWLRTVVESSHARYYDIAPFHAYPETWTPTGVVVENYLNSGYRAFVRDNETLGEAEPIWINEMGFAATPDRSEAEQANWWARAVSTFLADAHIEHIGIYEIKDLPLQKKAIGDEKNYYLGITRADRTKKLAFHTIALLIDLLSGTITTADNEAAVTVRKGRPGDLHWHLFKRPDGKQVLFVYDKQASPTLNIKLQVPGATAVKYELNGNATKYAAFDGQVLSNILLTAGEVAIFRVDP